MLSKTELKILARLGDDWAKEYTIREISIVLQQPYPQTHRAISSLLHHNLITKKTRGKSSIIQLILEEKHDEYLWAEIERKKEILKRYKVIQLIAHDLEKIRTGQFICILFGSYAAKKAGADSDIDLLFVIPDEYDYGRFEQEVKTTITLSKADINITSEKGLLEMWKNPLKLNVGNEILKKHFILYGAEPFLRLRRKYCVG